MALSKKKQRELLEQGLKVDLDPNSRRYQPRTINPDARGLLDRTSPPAPKGLKKPTPSTDRLDGAPSTDRHSMYVSKIRHTDYKELLRLFPPQWRLRERTLRHVGTQNAALSPIHLKASCLYLIGQAQTGKQKIKDYNAWLVGCFKDGAPITEGDIEMLLENHYAITKQPKNPSQQAKHDRGGQQPDDLAGLRRYLSASEAERAEIDALAQEKAKPFLNWVEEEGKRQGILEQAKIDATLEYFGGPGHTERTPK